MTTATDLLPLPEPVAVKYPDSGLRDDEHALRLWAAHGYDTGGEPLFSAEHLREATAPLQAEVEALRAKLECLQQKYDERTACVIVHRGVGLACSDAMRAAYSDERRRAERLAEALRRYGVHDQACVEENIPICTCGLDAALEQEAGRG